MVKECACGRVDVAPSIDDPDRCQGMTWAEVLDAADDLVMKMMALQSQLERLKRRHEAER